MDKRVIETTKPPITPFNHSSHNTTTPNPIPYPQPNHKERKHPTHQTTAKELHESQANKTQQPKPTQPPHHLNQLQQLQGNEVHG